MDQDKFEELKAKLDDFLYKGYIWPNISTWGAPLLFVEKKYSFLRCVLTLSNWKGSL